MGTQEKNVPKKGRRGRPPGRRFNETIPVRLPPETAQNVEKWAKKAKISRAEAARRLIDKGLAADD